MYTGGTYVLINKINPFIAKKKYNKKTIVLNLSPLPLGLTT